MKNDIHRHLDGELPSQNLDAEERDVVDEWDRMVAAFRQAEPGAHGAPPWLEQRVMAEIEALPTEGPVRRAARWLVSGQSIRISPLATGLVAAAITALLVLPGRRADDGVGPLGVEGPVESVVFVQFVLDAPTATSVAVAGDLSEWEPEYALEDADGDGVWTGRVPVKPGVHTYMFLIDGSSWQTDPNAGRYQDDGFGGQNAVLAVEAGV
jgi:hypothetical protein